jgi:LPXTG-site transpeptidase (sortase) family protein
MSQGRSVAAFLLGFAGAAAIGLAILLLATDRGGRQPRSAVALAGTALPSATLALSTPTSPAEFPLLADGNPAIVRPGHPDRIVIRSIGLDARVVDVGMTIENGKLVWETAAFAVGFYRGTALPGTVGNAVFAGHISSPVSHKGDIFRHLPEVRIGDEIDVFLAPAAPGGQETEVRYVISQIKLVKPTDVQVMDPTPEATVTLLTCYPDNVYTQRLVVVGKLLASLGRA